MILENRVKRVLREGGVAIGTMITQFRSPAVAIMLKAAGFDYFFIDMEHGSLSVETMADLCVAARGAGIATIVRVPILEAQALGTPLDLGASGVLCPQTETRADAELIVRCTKYHPLGERGMSLGNVHVGFERGKPEEVVRRLNEETLIVVQIETAKGVDNIDEILRVPGIDAAFVGPNDLSQTLGVPGQIHHPEVAKRIERLIEACQKAGVAPGLHTYDVDSAKAWLKKGIRLLGYSGDVAFIVGGGKVTSELREFLQAGAR